MLRTMIKCALSAGLAVVVLSACSSSDDAQIATYNDIIGTWKETQDNGDEYVEIIHDDGTFSDYDYLGDSFDNGADCYRYEGDSFIDDLGNGDFLVNDGGDTFQLHITMSGDSLFITNPFYTSTLVRSSITLDELQAKACP